VSAKFEGGDFSEVVRCEGATESAEFSIHPKFLAAALESGTTCVLGERVVKFAGCGRDEKGQELKVGGWEHVVTLKAPT